MAKPGHDIVIKVGLTADQYLHLVRMAEDEDVTQSAFMRRLLLDRIRSDAFSVLQLHPDAMPSPAPDQA